MDTKGVNPPTDLLEVSDQFVYNTTMYISPSLYTSLAEPILYCLACRTLRSGPVDYIALPAVPAGASRSHILITHPFSEALLDNKWEEARRKIPVPSREKAEGCMNLAIQAVSHSQLQ
jgi:hypothetical protein